jgi:hypothetical protein
MAELIPMLLELVEGVLEPVVGVLELVVGELSLFISYFHSVENKIKLFLFRKISKRCTPIQYMYLSWFSLKQKIPLKYLIMVSFFEKETIRDRFTLTDVQFKSAWKRVLTSTDGLG